MLKTTPTLSQRVFRYLFVYRASFKGDEEKADRMQLSNVHPRWMNISRVVLALLAFVATFSAIRSLAFSRKPGWFRDSALCSVRDIRETKGRVMSAFMDTKGTCGIAAANLRIYKAIFAMEIDGKPMIIVNPSYTVPDGFEGSILKGRDGSLMCDPDDMGRPFIRPTHIDAWWTTHEGVMIQKRLSGTTAACYIHFVEIIKGMWPCQHTHPDGNYPRLLDSESKQFIL